VSLAKRVNGVVTPLGQPQKFDVYMLDAGQVRTPAVLAFEQKVSNLQRAVAGANALVDELSTQVQALTRAIDETPSAGAPLSTDARALERDLRDLRESLNGDPTIGRRQEATPPSLLGRLNVLTQGARSLDAPTATQQHQYDIVAGEYGGIQTRLRAIVDTRLKQLDAAAEAAGVPWTAGRLPEWRP
jgi:hypothetical protein